LEADPALTISRGFDAITDPLIGNLPDNSKSVALTGASKWQACVCE
jgi:Na+/melibiose symporter-like transporter